MALLTPVTVDITGIEVTTVTADTTGSDTFANTGSEMLIIKNTNTVDTITVTIKDVKPCNYGYTHDMEIAIPAEKEFVASKLSPTRFNDTGGLVTVTTSSYKDTQYCLLKRASA